MVVYSIFMFVAATVFAGVSIAISKGKTDLIHDYHQIKVSDKAAYGKAFGKALLVIAIALLLSGIIGLIENCAMVAVAVLLAGLCVGIGAIIAVQKKHNKGVF